MRHNSISYAGICTDISIINDFYILEYIDPTGEHKYAFPSELSIALVNKGNVCET